MQIALISYQCFSKKCCRKLKGREWNGKSGAMTKEVSPCGWRWIKVAKKSSKGWNGKYSKSKRPSKDCSNDSKSGGKGSGKSDEALRNIEFFLVYVRIKLFNRVLSRKDLIEQFYKMKTWATCFLWAGVEKKLTLKKILNSKHRAQGQLCSYGLSNQSPRKG